MSDDWRPDTLGVRAGGLRSSFGEHSENLSLTASFVFGSAAESHPSQQPREHAQGARATPAAVAVGGHQPEILARANHLRRDVPVANAALLAHSNIDLVEKLIPVDLRATLDPGVHEIHSADLVLELIQQQSIEHLP